MSVSGEDQADQLHDSNFHAENRLMIREFFRRLFGTQKRKPSKVSELKLPHVSEIPRGNPPLKSAPAKFDRAQVKEWIHGQIERDVAAGYLSREEILQSASDCFMDELPEDEIAAFAAGIIDDVIAQHRADQANWPEETDCDRLDGAFRSLEEKGIIARQNFSCCGTCGSSEIWDEVDAAELMGVAPRGYAFFHMQDTESAVEGSGLYLNYGAKEEGEEAWTGIGREIQQELEAHGLETNWDGSLGMRIGVSLDWKRRVGTV